MSSLRNAISRRAHKERAQPEARKKFWLLEKHKDYIVHAKEFHKKEDIIRKPGRKRKLREEEIENPTSQPVYKKKRLKIQHHSLFISGVRKGSDKNLKIRQTNGVLLVDLTTNGSWRLKSFI